MDIVQTENSPTNKKSKLEKVDGVKTWLIVMVSVFVAHTILNNYIKFGIVKTPLEIFHGTVDLITRHWLLYCATVPCYFLQIFLVYIIEKLLTLGLLSENVGMALHALDVFFLPTAFTVLARLTAASPTISRLITPQIMYVMTKTWSYAFINSKFRKLSRGENINKNNGKDNSNVLKYPNNVTVKNLLTYFIFTPPIQYQLNLHLSIKPKWKAIFKYGGKQFLVLYMTAFVSTQFFFPELKALKTEENIWINNLKCIINIILPVSVLWLLHYYISIYRLYLPAYAEFAGREDVFSTDWWNSENLNVFWRKWNVPVHECLKYNVVIPLMKNGYSKRRSIFIAFGLAGILHEYLNVLPMGVYNGKFFLVTLLEIPSGYVTTLIGETFGNQIGNLAFWIYLITCHTYSVFHNRQHLPIFEIVKI